MIVLKVGTFRIYTKCHNEKSTWSSLIIVTLKKLQQKDYDMPRSGVQIHDLDQPGPSNPGNDTNSDNHLSRNSDITSNIDRITEMVIEQNMDFDRPDTGTNMRPFMFSEGHPGNCTFFFICLLQTSNFW